MNITKKVDSRLTQRVPRGNDNKNSRIPSTSLPSTSLPSTSLPSTSLPSTSLPSTSLRREKEITYFKTQSDFRKWLGKNYDKASELYVGFYKTKSGKQSITWPQSVDEALCFGWIDGIRKSIDDKRYMIRFGPRKPRSIWSAVNIKRAEELKKLGLMTHAGIKTFEERDQKRSGLYSFENRPNELSDNYKKKLKANKKAWEFFQSQAPWYRRTASFWVMSAAKEETRDKRLNTLIADSEMHKRIGAILTKSK